MRREKRFAAALVRRHLRRPTGTALILVAALLAPAVSLRPQETAGKIPGLPNFHAVNGRLFRGGQPSPEGFQNLKEIGMEVVIDFRNRGKSADRERQTVESLGMQYVSIPWKGSRFPTAQDVQRFFAAMDHNPPKKVFVHCRRGAERTGYMIGLYRVTREGWTAKQAADEMEKYGFRGLWYGHLKDNLFKLETRRPSPAAAKSSSAVGRPRDGRPASEGSLAASPRKPAGQT
ncbi:MAG TPA: protein tyrosine phosphatase family protein [Candidatus Acidoferrales bacterium]